MNNTLNLFLVFFFSLFAANVIEAHTEEIVILETETCEIEGTLMIPDVDSKVPLLIIIAGSGPTDRDGNSQGLQSNAYKYLAENLEKKGIASLRYDKRFIGKSVDSILSFDNFTINQYIEDAESWAKKYKDDKRFSEIIIAGHSQGALIGCIVSQNEYVDKYISLEGAGQKIDAILKEQLGAQSESTLKYAIPIIDSLASGYRVNNVPIGFISLFNKSVQPFLISWMKIDPSVEISKLDKPVLIVQGTTDIQVNVKEAELLKEANKNARLEIIEGMNHILKDADADRMKNLMTYYKPDLPINSRLVEVITEFILE